MKTRILAMLIIFMAGLMLALLPQVVTASPQLQGFFTPTPGPDGRTIYIVQTGDTCISISLRMQITEQQLRSLNNIKGTDCTILIGQKLLLGITTPPTAIPLNLSTATPSGPTATPFNGNGKICVYLFSDANGNGLAEPGESPLAGGAISITDRLGKINLSGTTTASTSPICFEPLPEGDYNVSLAVQNNYNATTNTNQPLTIRAGDTIILDFGAQLSSKAEPLPAGEGGRSPLLAIGGVILLLSGVGLAAYFFFMRRS